MSGMSGIRIEGLSKSYGAQRVLDAVSLDIEPGELFFLLGPSGCGKTTLLRSIAGFETPDAGKVFLGGEDVTRMPPHLRRTGMVFQNYALWPHMTVKENVAFGPESQRLPADEVNRRVGEALDAVGLAALADRRPGELSGGQQQRAALARALAVRPKCLLLDEPLSNLDPALRHGLRDEIRRVVKAHGLTAVYVTHDRSEAFAVGDRLAVMLGGKVAQVGRPREVYRRPSGRAVAGFVGEANFLEGKVVRCGAGEFLAHTALGEVRGALADPEAEPEEGADITVMIRPECLRLDDMPPEENAFAGRVAETVFLGDRAELRFAPDAGGAALRVVEQNPRHDREDDTLYAWAFPEDVVGFAR